MEQRSSPARSLPPRKTTTTPQLSCELCRKRKVKCDKLTPCTNCAASGTVCVPIYRTRLPRGRHATRPRRVSSPPPTSAPGETDRIIQPSVPVNEDLQERIYRLEALIQGMNSHSHTRTPSATSREQSVQLSDTSTFQTAPNPNTSPILNSSIVSKRLMLQRPDQFWADLVDEIHGLREVVESSLAGGQEGPIPSSDSAKSEPPNDDGIQVLGLGASNPSAALRSMSPLHNPVVGRQLCEVYLQQVDPVIKILHRPSLNRWMVQGEPYLSYADGHPSVEALGSAVCYSAISSMTDNQCSVMFHANKADLLAEARVACETAIGRAGLLTTRDITVLQAFVLYLVARRSEDRTPAVWTLIALAVRIGKGLGLYLDPETETFFDQQIRRRLWFTICLMDLQASFGQASEPLISVDESASTALPQHINDSDFDPTTAAHSDPNREGLTDTTFALVTYHAQRTGRLLNFVQHDRKVDGGIPTPTSSTSGTSTSRSRTCDPCWPQQQARHFEQEALRLLHFCDPGTSAYAWFTWHGTQSLIATVRLAAARPLQWHGQAPPPRREGNTELLRLCLPVLEKAQLMHTDPRAEGFRWYVTIPWYALAMALAECYVSSDTALVRYAWPLVESSYLQYEATLGQSLGGPFGQLMRRMKEKLAAPAALPPSSLPSTNWSPATPPTFPGVPRPQSSHDDRHAPGCSWPVPTGSTPPADLGVPSLLPVSTWEALSPPSLDNPSLFGVPPTTTAAVADGMDPGADIMWEELFSGIPFNEIAGPDTFFFDMNWGS
ncbi:hypothetical protein BDQ94DRAFT_185424 [Aspergillus welwitschiae]|uniref:Zn(2)-C6 fungal-type domain-containing protein n=1 Tax=Aspergillus welwitschiae TaxID=1341132 RepID=A0A3F3QB21_9EURO|nr:hypothetical protein BDQ94DRAFT_185424 [Aspergillus welwitschiae]RDH36309.1 hypothetical protein BDQ94DRAFT_185424 [Aspergillus welwitschiae]